MVSSRQNVELSSERYQKELEQTLGTHVGFSGPIIVVVCVVDDVFIFVDVKTIIGLTIKPLF